MVTGPARGYPHAFGSSRRLRAVCAVAGICVVLLAAGGCTYTRAYRRAVARERPGERVETYLSFLAERGEFSGYVLIDRAGEPLYAGGHGWANVEERVPFTERSQFRIASVSKQFTGAAILLCRRAGLLSLDDSAADHLPGTELDPAVTLRHLLMHTSGLESGGEPGAAFAYSNRGYNLLARVVEQVSGRSYADFLRERLWMPLAMADTEVDQGGGERYVLGYVTTDPPVRAPGPDYTGGYGAGGIVSTPRDLQRWVHHLAHAPPGDPLRFSAFTERTVQAVPEVRYGYGIGVRELDVGDQALSMYWHAGSSPGYGAEVCYIPELDVTMIILSNHGTVELYRFTTSLCEFLVELRRSE